MFSDYLLGIAEIIKTNNFDKTTVSRTVNNGNKLKRHLCGLRDQIGGVNPYDYTPDMTFVEEKFNSERLAMKNASGLINVLIQYLELLVKLTKDSQLPQITKQLTEVSEKIGELMAI